MKNLLRANLTPMIALGLLLSGPVAAQPDDPHHPVQTFNKFIPPGMMGQMPMMDGGMMMPMMGGGMMGMMMTHTDGYFAFLKTELAITAAQETVWSAFAGQLKEQIGQHSSAMPMMTPPPDAKPLTWIDRLTESETRMSTHLEAMKKIHPAAAALYEALSPEQKLKADALMPGGMGMHMGAMKMGGMHGGK
ncbi:MAG: Spy/CpxP family protein refolding chaperone [Alphaproteobacteria bacterium]